MHGNQSACCHGGRPDVGGYFDVPSVRDLMGRLGAGASDIETIRELVVLEWELFDAVAGLEGRASCQDDARSFFVYRLAQYLAFPFSFAYMVLDDARNLNDQGRNPVSEKYARMMAATDPDRYQSTWAGILPTISPVRACALRELEQALAPFSRAAAQEMPLATGHARVNASLPQRVSAVDYLLGEVSPYSLRTIWHLRDALRDMGKSDGNPILDAYAYACAIDLLPGV